MSKTVLVVDDELLIAIDIQSQLEELGHRALIAADLDEALNIVPSEKPDLAIVDWHLRDQVSAPLIEHLKAHGIPFILCSGSALEELAGLFPATPLVLKPFSDDQLVAAVAQVLDTSPQAAH